MLHPPPAAHAPATPPGAPTTPSSWHLGPLADMAAYHWSWLPVFVALMFFGPTYPTDFLVIALPVLGLNFAHQALTVLLVYGDGDVFRRDARRLTALPSLLLIAAVAMLLLWPRRWAPMSVSAPELVLAVGSVALLLQAVVLSGGCLRLPGRVPWSLAAGGLVLLAAWSGAVPPLEGAGAATALLLGLAAASIWTARSARGDDGPVPRGWRILVFGRFVPALLLLAAAVVLFLPDRAAPVWPAEKVRARSFMVPVTALAHVWNLWHFYRQKYGILRMHAGKSGTPPERAVPPGADNWLVFGWLPLLAVVLGPSQGSLIVATYKNLKGPVTPIIEVLTRHQSWLLPLAVLFLAGTLVRWVRAEWRASGLRNGARVSAAAGLTVLSACILLVDPVKGVLALGFSHIIEYLVFVWAFERRYYATPRATWLARWMRQPGWTVFGVAALLMCVHIYLAGWGKHLATQSPRPEWFGITAGKLLGSFGIFLSIFHFYVDGFVWKMRRPVVQAHV